MGSVNGVSRMKALVTDGHLEQALLVVKILERTGMEVHTTVYGLSNDFGFLPDDTAHLLPVPEAEDRFPQELLELLKKERFKYLFPISNSTMRQIALHRGPIDEVVSVDLRFRRMQFGHPRKPLNRKMTECE